MPDSYMLLGVTLWCWSTDYCEWDQFAALKYGWVAVQTEVSVPLYTTGKATSLARFAFSFLELLRPSFTTSYSRGYSRAQTFFTSLVVLDCLLA